VVAGPGEFAGKVIGQQDLAALLAAPRNCGQREARHHSPIDPVAGIPLILPADVTLVAYSSMQRG
jgi:hypothetical protein